METDRNPVGPPPETTAGGAPEPGTPATNRGRYRPAGWKRNLAWGIYALTMLVVLGVLLYAFL